MAYLATAYDAAGCYGDGAGYEIGYPCTPLICTRLDVGELLDMEC